MFIILENEKQGGFGSLDFEQIYSKYYQKVLNYLTFMLKTSKEAEDIAQEVFYKLIKNPPREDNIQGWLITVAKNLAINYLKSQKRISIGEKHLLFSQTPQDDIEILQVKMTLEKLPEEQRDLLILKYSGYTYEEIAKIMNINPNSVGTMIARAQRKFRKIYEEGEGE